MMHSQQVRRGFQVQAVPRDLTGLNQSLSNLNDLHATWSVTVSDTDAALSALEAAQAAYDAAKAAEATARNDYEAAQADYTAQYTAVPKEDSLP